MGKKGDFSLSELERIKCKVLNIVLASEVTSHFDLDFRGDMSFEDRKINFMRVVIECIRNYEIKDFVDMYGLDFFLDRNIITTSELSYLMENDLINPIDLYN